MVSESTGCNLVFIGFWTINGISHACDGKHLEEGIRKWLICHFADNLTQDDRTKLTEQSFVLSGVLKFKIVDGFDEFYGCFGQSSIIGGLQTYIRS